MSWGAGACSLRPGFTYYPTVDSETEPAFRMLSLLEDSTGHPYEDWGLDYESWSETLVPLVVLAITTLIQNRKCSPRVVDAQNRSLVHYVAKCVSS